jgi:hypothetical protein
VDAYVGTVEHATGKERRLVNVVLAVANSIF